jgi:hypothetical protein
VSMPDCMIRFPTPPSEPCMRLSPHTALQGSALLPHDYSRGRLPLRLWPRSPELHLGSRSPGWKLLQFQGCQAPAALRPVAGFPDLRLLWRHRLSPGFTGGLSPPFQGSLSRSCLWTATRLRRWWLRQKTQAALCGIPSIDKINQVACRTVWSAHWPASASGLKRLKSPKLLAFPHLRRFRYTGSWPAVLGHIREGGSVSRRSRPTSGGFTV